VSKQNLLLVDGDTRSLRVLEVSLRKAGFTVTPAVSVKDALDKLELHAPDLIISETTFSNDVDGFELRRRLRASTDWAEIPFVFLTAQTAIEHKIKGLELGVDDYLTKPIYIKEIITRINILLQKRQRARFEERKDGVRFAGRVADMPVVDVIQTIEISRKSGVINFVGPHSRQAAIYFRDGRVIDAEAGTLQAEDAVYRLLTWSDGEFEVVFRIVRRREVIQTSSQGLLMEGMRRLDEWSRLLEQLPPLSHRFEVDLGELAVRLGDVPDDNNRILRLIDGKRTVLEVIDASDFGDLECLQAISRLYFEGLLVDLDPQRRARRESGRPGPLIVVEDTPTPIEEVASGPIDVATLQQLEEAPPAPVEPRRFVEEPALEPETVSVGIDEIITDGPMDDVAAVFDAEPGPLHGSYRPSGLRLIDEAVAAAQAIEPSLFDDMPASSSPPPSSTNGAAHDHAIPSEIEGDEPSWPGRHHDDHDRNFDDGSDDTDPGRRGAIVVGVGRDDSGLRMIGSHGRDHAEVSGEFLPSPSKPVTPTSDPARELVTILPRRQTRDIPIVEPPPTVAAPTEPVSLPPPRMVSVAGGVTRAGGPGLGAKILLVLSAMLFTVALVRYCTKRGANQPAANTSTGQRAGNDLDASQPLQPPPPPRSLPESNPEAIDAAPPVVVADAAISIATTRDAGVVDAAIRTATTRDAGTVDASAPRRDAAIADPDAADKAKQAHDLLDKSRDAFNQHDYQTALALAEQSLALRKTARTFLERARALDKLGRLTEALASIDESMKIVKDYPPAWAMRGKMLHDAGRDDEAIPALRRYLELDPKGRDAKEVRAILHEPEP
jgi:CheY-like chemotaxis protein